MIKSDLNFYLLCVLFVTGCDNSHKAPAVKRPPWCKWLPADAQHQDKRLEVQFGEALYQIPVSYLVGQGANQNPNDYSYMQAYLAASYPDLVPVHKIHDKKIPNYPQIQVILSGHKDEPNLDTYRVSDWKDRVADLHRIPFSKHSCPGPTVSHRALEMNEYLCDFKYHTIYFSPADPNIKTPSGHDLYIRCNETSIPGANYECSISSFLYTDKRGVTTRIYLVDLNNLLDVYYKTIQLLESLEARAQS